MPDTAAFELAPDWVCEVLSPSTASVDRTVKMNIYRREAVAHVWLVDPDAQVVEVFRLDGERWLRVDGWTGAEHVRAEPFDAIELDLAVLWSR